MTDTRKTVPATNCACLLTLVIAVLFAPLPASARELLKITRANGEIVDLDLEALDALEQEKFTTETLWTKSATTFSGPPLTAVLEAAGVEAGAVDLIALNAYEVTMDLDHPLLDGVSPIVATRLDGEIFAIRDNGPLWIMFPFDDNPRLKQERIYSYSVWQLVEIRVSEDAEE